MQKHITIITGFIVLSININGQPPKPPVENQFLNNSSLTQPLLPIEQPSPQTPRDFPQCTPTPDEAQTTLNLPDQTIINIARLRAQQNNPEPDSDDDNFTTPINDIPPTNDDHAVQPCRRLTKFCAGTIVCLFSVGSLIRWCTHP